MKVLPAVLALLVLVTFLLGLWVAGRYWKRNRNVALSFLVVACAAGIVNIIMVFEGLNHLSKNH